MKDEVVCRAVTVAVHHFWSHVKCYWWVGMLLLLPLFWVFLRVQMFLAWCGSSKHSACVGICLMKSSHTRAGFLTRGWSQSTKELGHYPLHLFHLLQYAVERVAVVKTCRGFAFP